MNSHFHATRWETRHHPQTKCDKSGRAVRAEGVVRPPCRRWGCRQRRTDRAAPPRSPAWRSGRRPRPAACRCSGLSAYRSAQLCSTDAAVRRAPFDRETPRQPGQPASPCLVPSLRRSPLACNIQGTLPPPGLASAGLHDDTLSDGERHALVAAGWKSEGDEGYLYPTAQPGTTEIYHVYNTVAGIHFFTSSTAELDALVATPGNLLQQQTSRGFGVAFAAGTAPASFSAVLASQSRADVLTGPATNLFDAAPVQTGPRSAAPPSAVAGGLARAIGPSSAAGASSASSAASSAAVNRPVGAADGGSHIASVPATVADSASPTTSSALDAYWSFAGQNLATGVGGNLGE